MDIALNGGHADRSLVELLTGGHLLPYDVKARTRRFRRGHELRQEQLSSIEARPNFVKGGDKVSIDEVERGESVQQFACELGRLAFASGEHEMAD
mgnify:CR=1 FL=1